MLGMIFRKKGRKNVSVAMAGGDWRDVPTWESEMDSRFIYPFFVFLNRVFFDKYTHRSIRIMRRAPEGKSLLRYFSLHFSDLLARPYGTVWGLLVEWNLLSKRFSLGMDANLKSENEITFRLVVFLFSLFVTINVPVRVIKKLPKWLTERDTNTGLVIYKDCLHLSFLKDENEWKRTDPRIKSIWVYFPWEWVFQKREIFDAQDKIVFTESNRKEKRTSHADRMEVEKSCSQTFDCQYYASGLKITQFFKAQCYKSRMTHGMKWFPFVRRSSTSIWCSFDQEVGDKAGTYKGGVTGCGHEVLPGESVEDCLRRMLGERTM